MIHSFLLIGQSNAAGRGLLEEAPPLDTCNGKLLVARNGLWLKMFRPVNPDRKFSGTCFAETFAKAYSDAHPDVDVGIIPCADGGTCLEQWQPGQILFDNAVNCARLAMRTSHLVGILWHQGEGDCRPECYPLYYPRFRKMVTELRNALGDHDMPVLMGGLGDFLPNCTNSDYLVNYGYINEALRQFACEDENSAFVPATGLTSNPDNLHFSAKALSEFGYRYFQAFRQLTAHTGTTDLTIPESPLPRSQMEQL